MECRETSATLQVDAALLVSVLVATNIVDAEYLDASNVTVPGSIMESGQAKLLPSGGCHMIYSATREIFKLTIQSGLGDMVHDFLLPLSNSYSSMSYI